MPNDDARLTGVTSDPKAGSKVFAPSIPSAPPSIPSEHINQTRLKGEGIPKGDHIFQKK